MRSLALLLILLLCAGMALAQQGRPASPRGMAATEFGGAYEGRRYTGGKWIEIDYSRPILRGRTEIFGSGEGYGQRVNAGAPVWRAGANKSTRLKTDAALKFGDHTLPAGEYSLFVDVKPGAWTLILSSHEAMESFNRDEKVAIWGSYGYNAEKDVLRAPMDVGTSPVSFDQLTFAFVDMKEKSGKLAIFWENTMATCPFSLAE